MHTFLRVIEHSLVQFIAFFGVFIAGGIVLTLLARWTGNVFRQFLFPRFGLFVFGSVGVPVHELSHALFCKLFAHKVTKVKWFDARAKGGAQGSVTHSYNPWNLYQRIGHFFIGLGPAIFGPLLLVGLFYALVPAGRPLFHLFDPDVALASSFHPLAIELARAIVSRATLTSPGFYVFAYLAIAISSQIDLSPEDIQQAVVGVIPLLVTLFLVNVLAWALGASWHRHALLFASRWTAIGASVVAFAALLSALNLAICASLMTLINRLAGRDAINPFTGG